MSAKASGLWVCPECGFGFDAYHANQDGGYSCPVCREARLEAALRTARNVVEAACGCERCYRGAAPALDEIDAALEGAA